MLLAIGKFFSAVLQFILGIFTGIIKWAHDHPREAIIVAISIVLLIASNVWMHRWTEATVKAEDAKVITALQAQVKAANDETAKRDAKIKEIETKSKAAADETDRALIEAKAKSKTIVSEYEKKLATERKNYRVVYVKDKEGKDVSVNVDQQGSVICEKFSETFSDTVNKLIDNANSVAKPTPATTGK